MKHLIALALLCAPLFAQAPPHTVTLTWTWAQCTSATPPVCEGLATGFTVYKAPATTGTTCPAASALTQLATTTPVIVAASLDIHLHRFEQLAINEHSHGRGDLLLRGHSDGFARCVAFQSYRKCDCSVFCSRVPFVSGCCR